MPAPATTMSDNLRKLRYGFLSLAVVVLDQWTKWLVEVHLPHGTSHPVVDGFFALTHVRNTGVAFGLFARHGADGGSWTLIALGLVALVAVIVYFRFTPADHRLLLSSLALIVGGAVGNLIDRLATGAVTDFLDVHVGTHHWPAFNVADSAITVGIVLMIADSFLAHRQHARDSSVDDSEDEPLGDEAPPRGAAG